MLTIHGDRISGNCLKVKWIADHLGLAYRWVDVDVVKGEAKAPAYLADFPMGQVPAVVLTDGRRLAQSNAILLHLAEGSALVPADAFARAEMFQWLFWEQYTHEPAIAVRRFQRHYLGKPDSEIDPALMVKGRAALTLMARHLATRDWFAGGAVSCADVALVAYTRVAHEGGFDLAEWPAVAAWVTRVEAVLGIG
ncbi:MAG: glutathione S-transferase [Alphaproteobacteria bacterium PA4]|nr:MAG: glutathione S-transferase [Alphaproteobacteria bacterium PA4]